MALTASPTHTPAPTWSLPSSGNWGKTKIGSWTQKDAAFRLLYGSRPASLGVGGQGAFGGSVLERRWARLVL